MDSYFPYNEYQGLVLYGFWLAAWCLHVNAIWYSRVNKFYCYVRINLEKYISLQSVLYGEKKAVVLSQDSTYDNI